MREIRSNIKKVSKTTKMIGTIKEDRKTKMHNKKIIRDKTINRRRDLIQIRIINRAKTKIILRDKVITGMREEGKTNNNLMIMKGIMRIKDNKIGNKEEDKNSPNNNNLIIKENKMIMKKKKITKSVKDTYHKRILKRY